MCCPEAIGSHRQYPVEVSQRICVQLGLAALATAACPWLLAACSNGSPAAPQAPPTVDAPPAASSVAASPPVDEPALKKPASDGSTKTMFVDAKKVDCMGEGPMKCLRVRWAKDGEWELFYSNVEGFDFVEGTQFELRVEVSDVAEPPADSSSKRYRLVEVVSKKVMP
jgi:Domain of unknown function (DUF4377)